MRAVLLSLAFVCVRVCLCMRVRLYFYVSGCRLTDRWSHAGKCTLAQENNSIKAQHCPLLLFIFVSEQRESAQQEWKRGIS